jgi:hypothetical protein
MPEPKQLIRGKQFQKIVQQDFAANTKDGQVHPEASVSLEALEHIRQKSGRMDILISDLGDFVTILEIKATDWDRIKPANVKRNLYRHQKQLFMYIDKFVEIDALDVCLGIIYPKPPRKPGLKDFIYDYLTDRYGVPAYWYSEIQSTT